MILGSREGNLQPGGGSHVGRAIAFRWNGVDTWIKQSVDPFGGPIEPMQDATLATTDVSINRDKSIAYPNPVKDILYFNEEVSNVKITDATGRKVKEFSTKDKSINVANLAKGVYIMTATTKDGKTINQKVIKE